MIYIAIIIVIAYLFSMIWFANGIAKYNYSDNILNYPSVSIIVSAHNEEHNIRNLLDALINQDYAGTYEIIIANDRSSDSTGQLIEEYSHQYSFIQCITINDTPINWGPKKWALNECIQKAQYNIILQTDADCLPQNKWIESMAKKFNNSNVIFAFIFINSASYPNIFLSNSALS